MNGKSWPRHIIARVKGALQAGFPQKVVAYYSGVPIDTLSSWAHGSHHSNVEPERFPVELMEKWLKGQ